MTRAAAEIVARGGWGSAVEDAALRAARLHDAVKEAAVGEWLRTIRAAGEEPDAWSLAHAPHLLHAQAAAVWGAARGESDAEVLEAVRHHPTAHPGWGTVGRILYVADFCEPTRPFATELGTGQFLARAGEGPEGLLEASRTVLGLRLAWLLDRRRPIHPRSWEAWNAWALERGDAAGGPA